MKIDISAGASIKAEVKTEIPPESSGRFLDALTDIIRPFSERRGLKADLLRLQREKVAIEIAKIAHLRLNAAGRVPEPIPNRILVPLLEKASLTESDDVVLMQAWGDILANASGSSDPNLALFVDTLGKLSAEHLRLLKFLAENDGPLHYSDSSYDYGQPRVIIKLDGVERTFRSSRNVEEMSENLQSVFIDGGVLLTGGSIHYFPRGREDEEHWELPGQYLAIPEVQDSIIEGLVAANILNRVYISREVDVAEYWVDYILFTSFEASFYEACNPAGETGELAGR